MPAHPVAERLSSRLTFFYRAVFPALAFGGVGVAALAMLRLSPAEALPPDAPPRTVILLTWAAGCVYLLWFTRRLRDVFLLPDALLVSGPGRERRIPLDRVVGVTETRFWNPKRIKVRVEEAPGRQEEIVFLAPGVVQVPFTQHSAVARLKSRVEAAYATALSPAGASPLHRSER